MHQVCVMLCTNNPDNGLETGHVSCVEFRVGNDTALRLECVGTQPTCWTKKSRTNGSRLLRIGHRRFSIESRMDWVGNWCWNAVWVRPEIAVRIVQHLRATGKFEVEEGFTELVKKWETPQEFYWRDFAESQKS